MAQPIWKDYYITHPDAVDYIDFNIYYDDVIIYSGRAYTRPGETRPRFRINEICADYITRHFPLEETDIYFFSFRVTHGGYSFIITFTRDWSYDVDFNVDNGEWPSFPVLPILNPRQYLPLFADDGVYDYTIITHENTGDFSLDFNGDFSVQYEEDGPTIEETNDGNTMFVDLSQYSNLVAVRYGGKTYRVADLCGGYVLYYINAYGGWDWLPVQGRAVRTDGITHYTREAIYDNRTYTARETDNYVIEMVPRMRLTIGPLTTEQSARMCHLLGSTFVYLHDIEEGRIHPVTINAQSIEHKTRPGTLHIYEVEVALAQNRIRR